MLSPITSASPSSSRDPKGRRSDASPFYMHEDEEDAFYSSRKGSADLEAGCLLPPDGDGTVPNLTSTKTGRRGSIYAAYRRWFSHGASRAGVQLAEKGDEPRNRASTLERRVQVGSWTAMVILLVLTIYFLMRER
ncbi:hypothetical protein FB451DRAFT_1394335 [Mycena latifolia]|nr:hypothetical protein FB451DRAFT_1394335 [Mycena latifolia]